MQSDYIIEMLNIRKEFPGIVANDNITLQLRKGEIHALLGENGAGKSTLMSVLFGLYVAEEGRENIESEDLLAVKVRRLEEKLVVADSAGVNGVVYNLTARNVFNFCGCNVLAYVNVLDAEGGELCEVLLGVNRCLPSLQRLGFCLDRFKLLGSHRGLYFCKSLLFLG